MRKPATDDQASSKNLYSEKFLNKMRQQQVSTGTPRVSITAIQANTPNALPSKSPRRSSPRKKIAPALTSTLGAEDSSKESSKQFEVHVPTRDSYMGAVLVLPSNAATSLLNSATVHSGPADQEALHHTELVNQERLSASGDSSDGTGAQSVEILNALGFYGGTAAPGSPKNQLAGFKSGGQILEAETKILSRRSQIEVSPRLIANRRRTKASSGFGEVSNSGTSPAISKRFIGGKASIKVSKPRPQVRTNSTAGTHGQVSENLATDTLEGPIVNLMLIGADSMTMSTET